MDHPGDKIKLKGFENEGTFFQIEETEPATKFDYELTTFRIMRKMRECFGEKKYNSEKFFPDPRKKKKPGRKLRLK